MHTYVSQVFEFIAKYFVTILHLPMHAVRPLHIILLGLITRMSDEEYKLWSFSLYNFLQLYFYTFLC
jgi:hypothetical protein